MPNHYMRLMQPSVTAAAASYVDCALADATGVRLPGWRDSLFSVVSTILDAGQLRT